MPPMDEIYREHARMVYKYLMSLVHDADIAQELTQETFYQAIRSFGRFDNSCRVTTWLCAIAKRQYYTYRRKHPPVEELTQAGAEAAAPSAEQEALENGARVELLRLVHACPEPYREVLYLRIFGGLSYREIGAVMGKSENWARVTYYRGKEKVKKGGGRNEE